MSTKQNHYNEEFKRTLVELHQNGKSQSELCREYGVSKSALSKWVKLYSTIETEDGDVLTAKQIKELQKRNARLEEENLILKSHCHIHATLIQRLNAVHRLRCRTALSCCARCFM